jgi:hypothetical protein
MLRKICCGLLVAGVMAAIARPVRADITADQVRDSIKRGLFFLKSQQDRVKGNWPEYSSQPGGVTSLCTLALLSSGVEVSDPSIQRALNYLRSLGELDKTYAVALQTMVFCAAEPEKDRLLIARNVKWLEQSQISAGERSGAWSYSMKDSGGDKSNAQFALLALHEADRIGVPVSERTWRSALAYWQRTQKKDDGSWSYFEDRPGSGSMTCAGIASLLILYDKLPEFQSDAMVAGDRVNCCGEQRNAEDLERAFAWLGQHFTVKQNPGGPVYSLYYMYALERVGRMSGRRFFFGNKGTHDWYREGAEELIKNQDSLTGSWKGSGPIEDTQTVSSSFALLFLSKGRRPVVMAKYKHGEDVPGKDSDWDRHRGAVQNLVQSVEQRWRRDLTWQTIDAKAASASDLMETPVLFISGRDALNLTPPQKENLREYINQGGFIFAEDCCDGAGFDRQFRALMAELFPDSTLRLLPPDHPIWYTERKVNPDYLRPLYGLDACCRTSVVYCPKNLSCYWELARIGRDSKYPPAVRDEIDACLAIGENVLAYATNREVKEKLDRPQIVIKDAAETQQSRDALYIPKLGHSGGSNDAPNAWRNLLAVAAQQIQTRISIETRLPISPADPQLFDNPLVFMHGRRNFQFTAAERKSLAKYLERGGFLFADSICASPQFTESLRNELKAIFPELKLSRLPPEHPLLTQEFGGYDITSVTLRDPQSRAAGDPLKASLIKTAPYLEALEIDGRVAVIFSPYDISCAMENNESLECKGYIKPDAARIGVNVILYALQQ